MIPPLRLSVSERAVNEVRDLLTWLYSVAPENAERFDATYNIVLPSLCQEIAEQIAIGGHPAGLLDESGSLALSQPVRQYIFTKQRKRTRRSAAGTYRLFYTLLDIDGDGQVDTLQVLSVRHAAAQPLWNVESFDAQ